MNTSKQTSLGRLPSTLLILLFLSGCATNREVILDSVEEITVYTNSGPVNVKAKIDTGSTSSSVDSAFVKQYGLEPHIADMGNVECPYGQSYVKNANGEQCRDWVRFSFSIKGNFHSNPATVADRSKLSTPVLIGNLDTKDKYLVRPTINTPILEDNDNEAEEEKED